MLTDGETLTQPVVDSEAEVHTFKKRSLCEGKSALGWQQRCAGTKRLGLGDGSTCSISLPIPTLHDPASPNASHFHYRCCDKLMF